MEARQKIENVLQKAAPMLSKFLAVDDAFLRELVARDVITDEEAEEIKYTTTDANKVDELLNAIKTSTGAYDGFMACLNHDKKTTDLYHMMKKMENSSGTCKPEDMKGFEVLEKIQGVLEQAGPTLSNFLAVDDTFLRELVAREVITCEERDIIKNIPGRSKKVDRLLKIIKKSTGAYNRFMQLLNNAKTKDLYDMIRTLEDKAGLREHDMITLETREKIASILDQASPDLSRFLGVDNTFLRELVARDVITDADRQIIDSVPINGKKVDELLKIIKTTTGAYYGFMEVLSRPRTQDLYDWIKKLEGQVGVLRSKDASTVEGIASGVASASISAAKERTAQPRQITITGDGNIFVSGENNTVNITTCKH